MITLESSPYNKIIELGPGDPTAYKIMPVRILRGEIDLPGAKLTAAKLVLLADSSNEPSRLRNIPNTVDLQAVIKYGEAAETGFRLNDFYDVSIDSPDRRPLNAAEFVDLTNQDRTSGTRSAAIELGRFGVGMVARYPGGCDIGERKTDYLDELFEGMGAMVEHAEDVTIYRASGRLHSTRFNARGSVLATEAGIYATSLARGTSYIDGAVKSPEVQEQVDVMNNQMGAKIDETDEGFKITGVESLKGFDHELKGCRLEAASYAVLAAITRGRITVHGINPDHLKSFHEIFTAIGGGYDVEGDSITYYRDKYNLTPVDVIPGQYPVLDTDLAALLPVMSAHALWQDRVSAESETGGQSEKEFLYQDGAFPARPDYLMVLRDVGYEVEEINGSLLGRGVKVRYPKVGDLRRPLQSNDSHSISERYRQVESEIASGKRNAKMHQPYYNRLMHGPRDLRADFALFAFAYASGSDFEINSRFAFGRYHNFVSNLSNLGTKMYEIDPFYDY